MIRRDETTQLFHCPCGNRDHARYSYHMFELIVKLNPHPSGSTNQHMDVLALDHSVEDVSMDFDILSSDSQLPDTMTAYTQFSGAYIQGVPAQQVEHASSTNSAVSISGDHPPESAPFAMEVDDASGDHLQSFQAESTIPPSHDAIYESLLQFGIRVDPINHFTICLDCGIVVDYIQIHEHRKNKHRPIPGQKQRSALPPKDEILKMLLELSADRPLLTLSGPISAIEGVRVHYDGLKCTIPGCTTGKIFKDKRRFNEHCTTHHSLLDIYNRQFVHVPYHQIGSMRSELVLVEVLEQSVHSRSPQLSDILSHAHSSGLYSSETTYSHPVNSRVRGTLFAQTNWERCIEGVDLSILRTTALIPNKMTEPHLVHLVDISRKYFQDIANSLDTLSILTLRAVASDSPSSNFEKAPFRRPQEDATIFRYSDFMARFVMFLLRNWSNPVEKFDVPLHPQHATNLSALHSSLLSLTEDQDSSKLEECINNYHSLVFSLLSHVSPQFLREEWKDLFTLFLVAYHLTDNHGNTSRISQVPPTISAAQWCFRACGVHQTKKHMHECDEDSFK